MNTSYELFYFDNFIESYARLANKPVVYYRSTGWNNSSNVDAINASYETYRTILPLDLWTALKQSEHVFMVVDSIEDTMTFVENNLPESQAGTSVPENYIFYSLCNAEGQTIASNE